MSQFREGDLVVMNDSPNPYGIAGKMVKWIRDQTVLRIRMISGERIQLEEPRSERRCSVVAANISLASAKARKAMTKTVPAATAIRLAKEKLLSTPDNGHNGEAILVTCTRADEPRILVGPCHGFARRAGTPETVGIVTRIVRESGRYQDQQGMLSREELIHYYDFLLNRSPWADMYLHKSSAEAVKNKCLTVRTDRPGNLVQGALIATRHTWEYSSNVKLFCRLTMEYGCDEHVSYILAFMMSYNMGSEMVAMAGMENDHLSFSPYDMAAQGYEAFLSHTPLVTTNLYNEGGRPEGVKAAWSGEGQKLRDQFLKLFQSFGTTKKSFNPFVKARPTNQEDVRRMSVAEAASFVNHIQTIMAK